MAAKRKLPSPPTLPVEVVRYVDPCHGERQVVDLDMLTNTVVGFVAYEDDHQLLLVHEAVSDDDWRTRPVDFTQLPKSLIVRRWPLGLGHLYGEPAADDLPPA